MQESAAQIGKEKKSREKVNTPIGANFFQTSTASLPLLGSSALDKRNIM
ncbi:MAG: hypothetical protein Q7K28_03140 [Candidatus Wildermuthbacteria bacterium]|nr:hypothetical protein [Candidatus Wildermuthbacteria bacterium]